MAMNLFNSMTGTSVLPSKLVGQSMDLQSQAQRLAQAQTGKAAGPEAIQEVAMPGLGDLVQKAVAQQKQQPIAQLEQTTKGASQAQQQSQANDQLMLKSLTAKEQIAQQTSELLQKFEQQKDLLDLDRYQSELSQIQFGLRMQNTKYIDQLKLEGERARLDDASAFQEAIAAATFEDEHTLLKNNLQFKQLLFTKDLMNKAVSTQQDRDFQTELSKINLDFALRLAAADSDARNEAAKFGSFNKLIQIGGKAYASYKAQGSGAAGDEEGDEE